jgi:hypothetical protein
MNLHIETAKDVQMVLLFKSLRLQVLAKDFKLGIAEDSVYTTVIF